MAHVSLGAHWDDLSRFAYGACLVTNPVAETEAALAKGAQAA